MSEVVITVVTVVPHRVRGAQPSKQEPTFCFGLLTRPGSLCSPVFFTCQNFQAHSAVHTDRCPDCPNWAQYRSGSSVAARA